MNRYSFMAKGYYLLDRIYFSEKGINPRDVINKLIPDQKVKILDLCCGTLSNTAKIVKNKSMISVTGVDLSKEMLKVAKSWVREQKINNILLKCADATDTGLKEQTFDYIIIGLVLHESSPELVDGILKEAGRLLKKDGKLIVLEWEEQKKIIRRIKFAPLYLGEILNCKTFNKFYHLNKTTFFEEHGYQVLNSYHCNYSIVLEMKRKEL